MGAQPGSQAAAKGSNEAGMHPRFLRLTPREHEQAFFSQWEQLDLVNVVITPLVMTFYCSLFQTDHLPAVYCAVLLMKGYQLLTLVLPSARQVGANAQVRYPILLTERMLRQLLVVAMVGRGARFREWLKLTTATNSPAFVAVKMPLIMSGLYPFTFCLPLDFLSQGLVNTLFMLVHLPPTLAQVAYAPARLVSSWPQLIWLQWLLEYPCSAAVGYTQSVLQGAADSGSSGACVGSSHSHSAQMCSPQPLLLDQPTHLMTAHLSKRWVAAAAAAAAAVGTPAGPAPDLGSTAGRLILALTAFWMLFTVCYVPLFLSWCLERHLKSRFVARVLVDRQQEAQAGRAGAGNGATVTVPSSSHSKQVDVLQAELAPPVVLPLFPQPLLLHIGSAAVACFVAAELLVLLCVRVPAVAGMLWPQEVF